MCIVSPKLVKAGRHPNIQLIINSQITAIEGEAGNFTVSLLKKALYIDSEKCTGCGVCAQKCPVEGIDFFNEKMARMKATYVKYPQAVPLVFSINRDKCIGCGVCEGVCKAEAVEYTQQDQDLQAELNLLLKD